MLLRMVMQMQTVEQVKKRIDYLLERDQATEAEIEKVYNEAVDTLRAIVSDVHNRYAVDGVVVPANLYGKVTVKDMLLLKQQYDKLPDDLSASEQDRVDLLHCSEPNVAQGGYNSSGGDGTYCSYT